MTVVLVIKGSKLFLLVIGNKSIIPREVFKSGNGGLKLPYWVALNIVDDLLFFIHTRKVVK